MMEQAKRIYVLMIEVNKFSFFVMEFPKRKRKHVLSVSIELQKRLWKFWSSLKGCGNTSRQGKLLPNFNLCFYNSIKVWLCMFSISFIVEIAQNNDKEFQVWLRHSLHFPLIFILHFYSFCFIQTSYSVFLVINNIQTSCFHSLLSLGFQATF